MDPTFKINKKIKKIKETNFVLKRKRGGSGREIMFFDFFFLLLLLSSIYGNRTVGIRRGKNKKALLDEGYA